MVKHSMDAERYWYLVCCIVWENMIDFNISILYVFGGGRRTDTYFNVYFECPQLLKSYNTQNSIVLYRLWHHLDISDPIKHHY